MNKTMKWVEKELKDKIDFVIWTGDSARHDNDEDYPRSEDQVVSLNKFMVHKMYETFGKHKGDGEDENPNNDFVVPIVPNMGNNDILPHNIFTQGPNKWTRGYAKIWKQFIPEEQKHQFEQGAWFYVEVIRNKLAVFSLNTLYFFQSNAAVDGCAAKSEPGYQQMEWLRIQLQFMRDRGMKAMLIGHVPPAREDAKTSWDETCWQKYTLWMRQYRDVVVSSHYGHFNYDHFILQDFEDLRKGTRKGRMPDYSAENIKEDDNIHSSVSTSYFVELRDRWSQLPDPPKSMNWLDMAEDDSTGPGESVSLFSYGEDLVERLLKSDKKKKEERRKVKRKEKKFLKKIGGEYAERFALSMVGASVVPNLYPTLRVYEYNISGLDRHSWESDIVPPLPMPEETNADDEVSLRRKKYKFEIPDGPSKSSPPGPAYSPQTLSLVRYTQYFANLTRINNDFQRLSEDWIDSDAGINDDDGPEALKWKEGKHKGKKPHDKDHTPNPKKFKYEVHYDTKDDDVYQLKDLTVPRLVDLARRIGNFEPEEDSLSTKDESDSQNVIDEVDAEKKKKKKKKHKKKKDKKHHDKQNEAWYAFVRRAFVETMSPDEIEEEFGS